MSIYLHHTTILPDELTVRLNPVGKFAVIELGTEACDTDLAIHDVAEADSLIKAACEAKRLLADAEQDRRSEAIDQAEALVRPEPWGGALPVDAP